MTEYSLHSDLKDWYSVADGQVEVKVDDFVVDVVKDGLLIEIQTRNLSAIKNKLGKLLSTNQVRLVYPIAQVTLVHHERHPPHDHGKTGFGKDVGYRVRHAEIR